MNQNNLEGYLGGITTPINPYSKEGKDERALTYADEYRQARGDISMALYNQQVAEAQLLKQRQWALEDRDYNAPSALRKRLEEAGYNPALMSGMVATANAPVRGVQGSTAPGKLTDLSGVHNQTLANIMQAGQNIVSNLVSSKQAQVLDSNVQLNRAAAIKEMSQAAFTKSSKFRIDELLEYEKNAMELDNYQKQFDLYIDTNYKEKQIITSLNEAAQRINLTDAQIQKIAFDVGNQSRLTDIEASRLKNDIKMTASNILKNKALIKEIALHLSLGDEELAQQKIRTEVQKATKGAQKAGVWVDMVSKGIGTIIGGALLGTGAGKVVQGLKKIPRVGFY